MALDKGSQGISLDSDFDFGSRSNRESFCSQPKAIENQFPLSSLLGMISPTTFIESSFSFGNAKHAESRSRRDDAGSKPNPLAHP